jgi:hypothetical protein
MSNVGGAERGARKHGGAAAAKFRLPQFARRGALRFGMVTHDSFPGFHPGRKPPMIYLNSGVDSKAIGISNGSRGVAFSDLTFSRRVL